MRNLLLLLFVLLFVGCASYYNEDEAETKAVTDTAVISVDTITDSIN